MKSTAITLKDISFLSGFSVSTVSKALNNKEDISETTRKAIRGIAKARNYVPNSYAVGLRAKAPQAIAVIVPKVTEDCYSNALYYIQKNAEEKGYRVLLSQSFNDFENEKRYIKTLNDGVTKAIFRLGENWDLEIEESILPIVFIDVSKKSERSLIKQKCMKAFDEIIDL